MTSALRRLLVGLFAAALVAAACQPTPPGGTEHPECGDLCDLAAEARASKVGPDGPEVPSSPNAYLAYGPNAAQGLEEWTAYLNAASRRRAGREAPGAPRAGLRVTERETGDVTGQNDTPATAERIDRFGTSPGRRPAATIVGGAPGASSEPTVLEQVEDDGHFAVATDTGLTPGSSVDVEATIGDGPFGFSAGGPADYDMYLIEGLEAGEKLVATVDTPGEAGLPDSFLLLFRADGSLAGVDDDGAGGLDSRLETTVSEPGDHYLVVTSFGTFGPLDPTVPGSPPLDSFGTEGDYSLRIDRSSEDRDAFSFDVEAGDIVGVTGFGVEAVSLIGPDGVLRQRSTQDLTSIHPDVSPLPGGGDASASTVFDSSGTATLLVEPSARYEVVLQAFRPAKERRGQGTQVLFLDFDGARIDPSIFGGFAPVGEVELSPLADFLADWGLDASDEDDVIQAIVEVAAENLSDDIRRGANGDRDAGDGPNSFDIEIVDSRDGRDPWGDQFTSRVIVGGTIGELGIFTIGIAESIDVGDFESEESAVVLLDELSSGFLDLNSIPLAQTTIPAPRPIAQSEEDGSFDEANPVDLSIGEAVVAEGVIGDGAWGSSGAGTGDFDFFRIDDIQTGDRIVADVETPPGSESLDSVLVIFGPDGRVVDFGFDDGFSPGVGLEVNAEADGPHHVLVSGFGAFVPQDPATVGSPGLNPPGSEGSYSLTISRPEFDREATIDLIGTTVGNIVAHEAGHFFADWHTENSNGTHAIMDQGGNLPGLIGLGPDGVYGTADDQDVDFVEDTFAISEGFQGTEDQGDALAFGLSTGQGRGRR